MYNTENKMIICNADATTRALLGELLKGRGEHALLEAFGQRTETEEGFTVPRATHAQLARFLNNITLDDVHSAFRMYPYEERKRCAQRLFFFFYNELLPAGKALEQKGD